MSTTTTTVTDPWAALRTTAYVSTSTAARYLGITGGAVRRQVIDGTLPGIRSERGRWMVETGSLLAMAGDYGPPVPEAADLPPKVQFTAREAATWLGRSIDWLANRIERGDIPATLDANGWGWKIPATWLRAQNPGRTTP